RRDVTAPTESRPGRSVTRDVTFSRVGIVFRAESSGAPGNGLGGRGVSALPLPPPAHTMGRVGAASRIGSRLTASRPPLSRRGAHHDGLDGGDRTRALSAADGAEVRNLWDLPRRPRVISAPCRPS